MAPPIFELPMLRDIQNQRASLSRLLAHHTTDGSAMLTACAGMIRGCRGRIFVSGMGASHFAALPAVGALASSGQSVLHAESAELLHYGEGNWGQGDIALLISRSGGSVEVLSLAEKMRRSGVRLIGVTNVAGSPLAQLSDLALLVGSAPDQLIAVQTYTGAVLTLLLLAELVARNSTAALADAAAGALPCLDDLVEDCLRDSDSWHDLLVSGWPLYFLGRGPALATVHEGSLLFNETAKAAAVPLSSGQFRHGPVEVVSPDFRAIVIGTPAPTRSLDWQLAQDLSAMGGRVLWIGPAESSSLVSSLLRAPWPDAEIRPSLLPLFDIVPLQIAAYSLALARGITPGDFRYASEVTTGESGFPLFAARTA